MSREHVHAKESIAAVHHDSVKLTADIIDSRMVTQAIAGLAEALTMAAAVKYYGSYLSPGTAWLAETGCWVWQRSRQSAGYGWAWVDGSLVLAHRAYYEQHVGPIPEGLTIDHLCRNRACVNPEHLEAVTNAVNSRRGAGTKLTGDQVRAIRRAKGRRPPGDLAAEYGVSVAHVRNLWSNRPLWVDAA